MRVKLLRNLGKNLPPRMPDEVEESDCCENFSEGQVREVTAKAGKYLTRTLLAEETTDPVTPKEPVHAAPPTPPATSARGK